MARITKRSPLNLTDSEKQDLQALSQSRTSPKREVERADILLRYAARTPILTIARDIGTTPLTVYKCIDKALSMGVMAGLKDLYHRPKGPVITPEAKA